MSEAAFQRLIQSIPKGSYTEAIYQNLACIKNRYSLLQTYALKKKRALDFTSLSGIYNISPEFEVLYVEFRDDWSKPKGNVLWFKKTYLFSKQFSHFPHQKTKKVTLSFNINDLNLTDIEKHKFLLLAQEYYNKQTGFVSIECEKFPLQSQNEKFLKDTFNRLLEEAKVLVNVTN